MEENNLKIIGTLGALMRDEHKKYSLNFDVFYLQNV